jgi:hypothetical protein
MNHDRWVVNKLRALGSYYTKGHDRGAHLRTAINAAQSLVELRDIIASFFFGSVQRDSPSNPRQSTRVVRSKSTGLHGGQGPA